MTDRIVAAPVFDGWAIVELMGHRVRCGRVTEVELAGGKMLRIDVHCADGSVVTEFYAASALYALRPCSEEVAKARTDDPRPIRPVEYREREARRLMDFSDDAHDEDAPPCGSRQ